MSIKTLTENSIWTEIKPKDKLAWRRITELDKDWVSDWIARDATHVAAGITFKDVMEEGTEAFLISDLSGVPIMIVREHLALRIAIQFNPDTPFRSARHAPQILKALQSIAKSKGATEIIIRPGGKSVHFANKLGFKDFIGKFFRVGG